MQKPASDSTVCVVKAIRMEFPEESSKYAKFKPDVSALCTGEPGLSHLLVLATSLGIGR